eukprot:13292623-Alexandrium_andersonii.AAC.1
MVDRVVGHSRRQRLRCWHELRSPPLLGACSLLDASRRADQAFAPCNQGAAERRLTEKGGGLGGLLAGMG